MLWSSSWRRASCKPKQLAFMASSMCSGSLLTSTKPSTTSMYGLRMASQYSWSVIISFRHSQRHLKSFQASLISKTMPGVWPICFRNMLKCSTMMTKSRFPRMKTMDTKKSQNHIVADTGAMSYISSKWKEPSNMRKHALPALMYVDHSWSSAPNRMRPPSAKLASITPQMMRRWEMSQKARETVSWIMASFIWPKKPFRKRSEMIVVYQKRNIW
mmetsp:Transcript_55128/g.118350  ORF Transcript_55128/g.118350 Transcript_55128/m.118350 type:complete len:215 (-) Transcript_55128:1561-2205(-)